jgi:hypothetical protein
MELPRRCLLSLALASLPVAAGGCLFLAVGAAAAFGVVMYLENEAYQDFHADLDTTWNATLAAMRKLGYPVQEGMPHSTTEGEVKINDAHVRVTRESGGHTRVHVRIGTFETDDHRRRAALLLEEIAKSIT